MNTIQLPFPKPHMIAHRGLSGLEVENTCSAFVAAGNRGFFGIETDVHITSDGQCIIIHDDTTGRVANKNLPVEKTPYAALRELKLKDRFEKPARKDLALPSLTEYSQICKKYEKTSVLELKNPMEKQSIERVIDCVRNVGWLENTIFISFDLNNLLCLRSYLPEQKAQYLTEKPIKELPDLLAYHHLDLDIRYRSLTKELAQAVHEKGREINVWTVNTIRSARRMIQMGVDYITTNILE